jgi:hypothetical protein
VSGRVDSGLNAIRKDQDSEAVGIVTESQKRQADYRSATGDVTSKVWTKSARHVSGDAGKVIEDVSKSAPGDPP